MVTIGVSHAEMKSPPKGAAGQYNLEHGGQLATRALTRPAVDGPNLGMQQDIPDWPTKMTRAEQRLMTARRKEFSRALRAHCRAAGWRHCDGRIFRREGDWFVSSLPWLLWQRGVSASVAIKPMAIDTLFWDIVGLPENEGQPLSFRATGAWTIDGVWPTEYISLDVEAPETLARNLLDWASARCVQELPNMSIGTLITKLSAPEKFISGTVAWAICLHILNDDLDQALHICDLRANSPTGDGYVTISLDGAHASFIDQARRWIVQRRWDDLKRRVLSRTVH